MELWVRSQDKLSLMKCDRVEISERQINGKKWEFAILAGCVNVGVYSTKERCLEIIDEIQKILLSTGFIFLSYPHIDEEVIEYLKPLKPVFCEDLDCGCKVEQLQSYVYEMPQE